MSRTLSNYNTYPPIIPDCSFENYFLTDENKTIQYKNWGKNAHEANLFGASYSSYTVALNSGGLLTKIDFKNGKTLALKFEKPMMGSQAIRLGFYSNENVYSSLFFAYLTSSIFLLDAIVKSRKRRAEFARINQIDFFKKYKFPNLGKIISENKHQKILDASNILNKTTSISSLNPLPEQVNEARIDKESNRRKLDEAWFEVLGIPVSLIDLLYQEIQDRLKDIIKKNR